MCRIAALLCIAFTAPSLLAAETSVQRSFEQSYVQLQNKLTTLKQKGEKISAQSQKEIDALMAQMNHEHAELKRELDRKNQQLQQQLNEGRKTQEDMSARVRRALTEIGGGIDRAWKQLKGSDANSDASGDAP
jgi:Skp family chaperone for outer membrane proteins